MRELAQKQVSETIELCGCIKSAQRAQNKSNRLYFSRKAVDRCKSRCYHKHMNNCSYVQMNKFLRGGTRWRFMT